MAETARKKMPNWYDAENMAEEVAMAVDRSSKDFGIALFDPDVAHFLKKKHLEIIEAARVRFQADIDHLTGGQ